MRMIDADALSEQIEDCKYFHSSFQKMTVAEFLTIVHDFIDNAPTVEYSLKLDNITEEDIKKFKIIWQRTNSKDLLIVNCNDCDGYEAGYSAGLRDAKGD